MNILITGCNGYIGRHVYNLASTYFDNVVGVSSGENKFNYNNYIKLDLLAHCNDRDLFDTLRSPDVLIHLAWTDGFNHNSISHIENLPRHLNFLKNIVFSGCKSVSVIGSMHEIGFYEGLVNENTICNPMSLYGISKNALKQSLFSIFRERSDISFKWLRAYYVTGDDIANNSIFSKIIKMNNSKQLSFPFTNGENKYDFIDIRELSKQILCSALQNKINGVVEVCSGNPVSLKDKVNDFIFKNKLSIKPNYGEFPSRPYDSKIIYGDTSKIKEILNLTKSLYL